MSRWRPQVLVRAILALGLLVMLGANLPGHLSYDSVAQLHEGRFHVRETWQPVLYAWLLGAFDRIVPGTALYVTVSALLLTGSLAVLAGLRGRTSWLAVPVVLAAVLTPQLAIFQAIVWKDVMFANAAVAAMACLAAAAQSWTFPARRWTWLIGAALLLAVAGLVRQNGLIVTLFAAIALGWIAGQGRLRRGAAWGGGGFAVALIATQLISAGVQLPGRPEAGLVQGLRIVQQYDLVGAIALDPAYATLALDRANPAAARTVRIQARDYYSAERIDFINRGEAISAALDALPGDAVQAQWRDLILTHPGLYLRVRAGDFRWVFLTPVVDRCLPSYVGVAAPAPMLADLALEPRWTRADQELANYWTWSFDTPVYSHAAYAVLALGVAGFLLWRRGAADIAVAALQLAALGFAASFLVISIACDYRYLYFLDLAAIAGAIYLAADPSLRPSPLKQTARSRPRRRRV